MSDPVAVEPLANHLKGLPDLERALARVHYGKCAPNELVAVLKAFQKVSVLGRQAKASADDLQSALLTTIIGAMPDVSARLDGFLDEIDQKAACATTGSGNPAPDKHNLLKGYRSRAEYPKIAELKHNVKKVSGVAPRMQARKEAVSKLAVEGGRGGLLRGSGGVAVRRGARRRWQSEEGGRVADVLGAGGGGAGGAHGALQVCLHVCRQQYHSWRRCWHLCRQLCRW